MHYYAQINDECICHGVSSLSGPVSSPNMVPIDSYDTDCIYRKYDESTGTWSAEKFLPDMPAIQLTQFQQVESKVTALEAEDFKNKQTNAKMLLALARAGIPVE